ncbi:MAG TPA: hypothetical protein VFY84_19190 [Jiangellales bacterium]|nr:hypothetical protein [Jiangellales bacterium]
MSTVDDENYFTPAGGERASEDGSAVADPYAIPPLVLPSGGKVRFHPTSVATTKDVRYLRRARDAEGAGSFFNDLMERAMRLLIEEWEIPGRPTLRVPKYDPKATESLIGHDLIKIEKHLTPFVMDMIGDDRPKADQGEDLPANG